MRTAMGIVARTHTDEVTVTRVDSVTIDDVRQGNISRFYVGTNVRDPDRKVRLGYEFEIYVGQQDIFLVSLLRNAPSEGTFPEGHVYVRASLTTLSVGSSFTIDQMEPFLREYGPFTITYIEVPYKGE